MNCKICGDSIPESELKLGLITDTNEAICFVCLQEMEMYIKRWKSITK